MEYKNTQIKSKFSGVKVHQNAYVDPSAELHDGVIISQGAIIGPNVTIGENTIIGAHSLVTKSIPDNALAVGVPAKIIKKLK